MPTILLQYLPYLFQAAKVVQPIFEYIVKMRANLQQDKKWSPELEAAFTKELQDLRDNPPDFMKTDEELGLK